VSLHFRRLELLPSDAYLLPSAVVCTTSEDLVPTQGKYRGADVSTNLVS
jgi:hypothetical protein